MSTNAAIGLAIAGVGFLMAHAFVYTLGGVFFKTLNVYYVILFLLELVPTFYIEFLLVTVYLDTIIPAKITMDNFIDKVKLQRALYMFKPWVEVLALSCLFADTLPTLVGLYTWQHSESDSE